MVRCKRFWNPHTVPHIKHTRTVRCVISFFFHSGPTVDRLWFSIHPSHFHFGLLMVLFITPENSFLSAVMCDIFWDLSLENCEIFHWNEYCHFDLNARRSKLWFFLPILFVNPCGDKNDTHIFYVNMKQRIRFIRNGKTTLTWLNKHLVKELSENTHTHIRSHVL